MWLKFSVTVFRSNVCHYLKIVSFLQIKLDVLKTVHILLPKQQWWRHLANVDEIKSYAIYDN